ncbi:hypothetical protein LR48_Vigan04g117000 [Vigna angularis]|uniref:Uncharacterized protein n=1 Tax=Phaseolus angularis TaxID=3914 RepID=A0A0L9UEL3_PHAAN|nr:hypothetical protein LR48_Vigan04g117000 [Vigna angularis]
MSSDFSGDEGRGYVDNDDASPSSSLAAFASPDARASPSGNSSDLLVDSDAPDEVAIHVDSTGAWDGKPRAWPPVLGYEWVPHEVRQLPSSFYDRQAFRNLIPHVCLVKSAVDARHFKLAPYYLSKMDPSKNSTFTRLFAQRGGDVRKPGGSSSHAPSAAAKPVTPRPAQQVSIPPPPVETVADPAPPSKSPPKKKGKRKAARETSAESKHAKRSLPDGPPLPSLLSPNSWVAKHLHFDHFAEDKALVSGMTEEEASNMSLELTARATLCQAYAAHKKASASAELQALQAKLESSVKANQDLTLRLAETEWMAEEDKKKASTLLAEGQVKLLGDEVVNEHVLGFDKAVAQCHLLFQVPTDDPRLDVSMMVVDEKLVPIHVPPSSPPVGQNVEAAVEAVGETGEAEGQP